MLFSGAVLNVIPEQSNFCNLEPKRWRVSMAAGALHLLSFAWQMSVSEKKKIGPVFCRVATRVTCVMMAVLPPPPYTHTPVRSGMKWRKKSPSLATDLWDSPFYFYYYFFFMWEVHLNEFRGKRLIDGVSFFQELLK